jgi:hypothetical protein
VFGILNKKLISIFVTLMEMEKLISKNFLPKVCKDE